MIKVILVFLFLIFSSVSFAENETVNQEVYKSIEKYHFSYDWFSQNIPIWSELLGHFKGKPNIHYLEIGVFEGRSLIWMLENILTHSNAKATGIDIFPQNLKQRCLTNLKKSGFVNKVTLITGKSQSELKRLPPASFDIIYIDGSHVADDVETDAVLGWLLLKNEGVMIFDDYLWDADLPQDLKPKISIDCFITVYRNEIEKLYKGYQVIITKKQKRKDGLLRIGQYEYQKKYKWEKGRCFNSATNKEIKLSDSETALIENLFNMRRFGELKFSPTVEMLNDINFKKLKEKLNLNDSVLLVEHNE